MLVSCHTHHHGPTRSAQCSNRTHTAGFAHDQGGIQLSKLHLLLDGIRPSGFLGPCQLLATFVAGGVKLEGLPPGVRRCSTTSALYVSWRI
jgi:hypothetical protein